MSQHAQSKDWLKASGKDKDPKQEPRMRALFNIAVQDMDGEAARANAPGLIRHVTVGEETDTSNRTGQTGSLFCKLFVEIPQVRIPHHFCINLHKLT